MARVAERECTGSFSSVSNTGEVEDDFQLHHHQLPYHSKAFLECQPEMGNDDGDLQQIIVRAADQPPVPPAVKKKKRSLPGTPDPSAEVIALSPRTLMATNRFVCEICHKGFQRDQNLQLHRRGHNLPWKLRQRGAGEAAGRKRVYVCPEASCVHHAPGRALGDLTGIKKHFCRKHGEKKWKCDRCAKRYAVHSDWKAHSKVCGTREYKCDCGTVFSRRDSFVTHRAFCDALTQENNKVGQPMNMATVASALQGQTHHHLILPSSQADDMDMDMDADDPSGFLPDIKGPHLKMFSDHAAGNPLLPLTMAGCMLSSLGARGTPSPTAFSGSRLGPFSMDGSTDAGKGLAPAAGLASMSATALLQKAAQMGATATNGYGVGGGSMMVGLDRLTFDPMMMRTYGPYDGLPFGQSQTQLVGFGGGRLPYDGGAHGVGSTHDGGSPLNGGRNQQEHRRAEDVEARDVVDYMGVKDQVPFNSVGPFGHYMGPWA